MNRIDVYNKIFDNPIITFDIFNSFLGDFLGSGYSRYVFESNADSKSVIKIDHNSRGSNFMEWEVWNTVKDTKFAKWFAPCTYLSPDGKLLIQKKVKELISSDRLPKQLPSFFHDVRPDNFGMLNGKVVCFDYALTNLLKLGLTNEKRDVTWNFDRECSIA